MKDLTRRKFIKTMGVTLTTVIVFLWRGITNDILTRRKKEKIYLPDNILNGINISDKIIIIKDPKSLKVYSTKCTHLGCKINNQKNDQLICPCHGSKFNLKGIPINGPAVKKLNELVVYKEHNTGKQFVNVG